MPAPLRFDILGRSSSCAARLGRVHTLHGSFDTPAFMPVGTKATVKGLFPESVAQVGSQIILNNTYHLLLRPGADKIAKLGGVHRFMRWNGPILTDSGGFQAFSLSDISSLTDEGVTFRSIVDGSLVHMSPEMSISVQNDLGSDIIMAFDDCPPARAAPEKSRKRSIFLEKSPSLPKRDFSQSSPPSQADYNRRLDEALDRTARWLERCVKSHRKPDEQALFGIVQGGTDTSRREKSVAQICSIDLPGYAIGGVAVGEESSEISRIVAHTAPLLPQNKPRYLMGVGYEWDILNAVQAGVDMFDCVLPTRNGRNATAFTRKSRINLRNARFSEDPTVIDPTCACPVCLRGAGYSTAYLRHLFQADEMLGPVLVSLHNIAHFQSLMREIREAIVSDDWAALCAAWPVLTRRQGGGGAASEGDS